MQRCHITKTNIFITATTRLCANILLMHTGVRHKWAMPSLYVVFSGNLQTQAGGAGPPTHTEYILEQFKAPLSAATISRADFSQAPAPSCMWMIMLNDNTEWVEGGFASVNRLHIYFILLCRQHIVHSETLGSEGDPWPQGARSKSRECFLILSPPQSPARQRVWDCSAPVSPEVCKRGDAPLFRGFISFGWACVRRYTDI